jgi:hypothetical protein
MTRATEANGHGTEQPEAVRFDAMLADAPTIGEGIRRERLAAA